MTEMLEGVTSSGGRDTQLSMGPNGKFSLAALLLDTQEAFQPPEVNSGLPESLGEEAAKR